MTTVNTAKAVKHTQKALLFEYAVSILESALERSGGINYWGSDFGVFLSEADKDALKPMNPYSNFTKPSNAIYHLKQSAQFEIDFANRALSQPC